MEEALLVAWQRPPAYRSVVKPRKPRAPKYSSYGLKVLQKFWAASGGQRGKYLATSMTIHSTG